MRLTKRVSHTTSKSCTCSLWYYNLLAPFCRKNDLEELMLLNLSKKTWTEGLLLKDFEAHATSNDKVGFLLKLWVS